MGGRSRSSTTTVNNAYDNRTFIDDRDFTRIDYNYSNEYNYRTEYNVDNSVRNDYDYNIDNSVRNDYEIDNSVTNNIDNSITDAYNTTVEDGGIYVEQGGEVTVQNTTTDLGAIEAALGFAEKANAQANELTQNAIEEAFKSTVGGLQDQQQKWLATVSGLAVAAVTITAFAR